MIRRIKRVKPKKRFTPVTVVDPVKTGDPREHLFLPPLEPQRRWFKILSVVVGVWIAFLIVMYWTTLHPIRTARPNPPATQNVEPIIAPTTSAAPQ